MWRKTILGFLLALGLSSPALAEPKSLLLGLKTAAAFYANLAGGMSPSAVGLAHTWGATPTVPPTYFDASGNLQTAPNNSLTWSTDFTNAAWIKSGVSATGGASDPFGGTSAQTITCTSAGGYTQQNVTSASTTNIASLWVRRRTGSGTVYLINPANGNSSIAVTGSWQRFYLPGGTNGGTIDTGIIINTIGDQVDVYGAQLEQVTAAQTTPNSFIPTSGSAYFGPVVNDHNPSTLAALGLRSEPQRSNSVLNSAVIGGVAGTPGVYPNGATSGGNSNVGSIVQTLAFGAEDGIPYMDVSLSGTSSASGQWEIVFSALGTPALTGQVWAASAAVKAVTALTNVSAVHLNINELTSGAAWVTNNPFSITPGTGTLASSIVGQAVTLHGGATTAQLQESIQIGWVGAVTINITLRTGLTKLEQSSFITSPMLTYGAAVTVPADNWSFAGTALAQIKRGNFCAVLEAQSEGTTGVLLATDGGSYNNSTFLQMSTSTVVQSGSESGGVVGPGAYSGAGGNISTAKRRAAYSIGGGAIKVAYDGTATVSGASSPSPVNMTRAMIGQSPLYGNGFYGWFSQILVKPSCTAAQLQAYSTAGANMSQ